jgi:ribA/ribD-fused uncharacterized protein
MITRFNNEYEFLSNFYEVKITWQGITYRNVEAAYQAQKCMERSHEFANLTGAEAKKLGRVVPIDPNWEYRKLMVMKNLVYLKFAENKDLKQKLLSTGNEYIEEGNWWGDTYWGVCTNKKYDHVGENHLGKILMEVRQMLQNEKEDLE